MQRQRALESWLLALAEQHESLLWVWEDLHWGDAASVRLLRHALALLQGRPLAVLAFARPEVRMTYGALLDEHHARLIELSPLFTKTKHMLGDDFTMLDVAIAPLLWRLDHYGIKLGKTAAPLMKYAERIFSRPAFIEALTPSEKVMRK